MARLDSGWTIATVEEAAFVGGACDVADIVVSARRVAFSSCRSGARLLTTETMRRSGAVEIHLGRREAGEMTLTTSFEGLTRPWSIHRRYDWRSASFVPDSEREGVNPAMPEAQPSSMAELSALSGSGE